LSSYLSVNVTAHITSHTSQESECPATVRS